jgi:hypothetical protein
VDPGISCGARKLAGHFGLKKKKKAYINYGISMGWPPQFLWAFIVATESIS